MTRHKEAAMFDQPVFSHADLLAVLARADVARLTALAEALLPQLGAVEVVHSRTGLVMLPMRDTVKGTDFHLGEVLVAEAHLRAAGTEGYGMVVGRDLEQAMAMAVVDAVASLGQSPEIMAFLTHEAAEIAAADTARLCAVEATRVDMETF
jgi:alpha-D-ribose 1-methylphosphonate 5-triphosphate synthase subunit PhnG